MTEPLLALRNVSKAFRPAKGRVIEVLSALSLEVTPGEIAVLFGPNGCGKSTVLHILSGLIPPDSGEIAPCERHTSGGAGRPKVALLFQDFENALLPWRTAWKNLAFPFELDGVSINTTDPPMKALIETLQLRDILDTRVHQLSGGYKHRVALAQALVQPAELFLLDEPWSSLDNWSRPCIQSMVRSFLRSRGKTAVIVSHDLEEAIFIADRVVVLSSRPATVLGSVSVAHPDTRPEDFARSDGFLKARSQVQTLAKEATTCGRSPGSCG